MSCHGEIITSISATATTVAKRLIVFDASGHEKSVNYSKTEWKTLLSGSISRLAAPKSFSRLIYG